RIDAHDAAEGQRFLVIVVDLEAADTQRGAGAAALDLAADDQPQPWVDLLLEPWLVEPHGGYPLVAAVTETGPENVKTTAAAGGGTTHHGSDDGGDGPVLEGGEVGQQAAVLVSPWQVV